MIQRNDTMKCICEGWPDPMCFQYDTHLEHAGEPKAFPAYMFPIKDILRARLGQVNHTLEEEP